MGRTEKFIEDLLRKKGFSEEDGEGWNLVKRDLLGHLAEQVDKAVLDELPSKKLDELSERINEGNFSSDEMQEFLEQSGVDVQKVVLETMAKFKVFFLDE